MTDDTTADAVPAQGDVLHRFLFDNTDIRGDVVSLTDSYGEVLDNNAFPAAIQQLLGEFLAAVSLLSGRLKVDGILTLQARGDGPLPLIMAECTNHKGLRAVAQVDEAADLAALESASLPQLLGKGVLAMIMEPEKGQRYQGIVPLDSDTLAGCLEHYFEQSEQLSTRVWLNADAGQRRAAGMILQAMPQQVDSDNSEQNWETAVALAETVTAEEMLGLDHPTLLYRLFNELQVRMFDAEAVNFHCRCSTQSSGAALLALGRQEVEEILAEQELIVIDCHFCNKTYRFGHADIDKLFGAGSDQIH